MKIDCTITVNYFAERQRMCRSGIFCAKCPLENRNNGVGISCAPLEREYPDKAVEIVQKWSDEHQQKTYADDHIEDWGKLLFEKKKDLVESLVTAQHESIKNNAEITVVLYNDGSIGKLYENAQSDLGKYIEIGYFNPETSSAEQDFLPEEVVEQIIATYIE